MPHHHRGRAEHDRPQSLWRVRPQGRQQADYKYSPVVAAAGFDWDAEHLDKWLDNPRGFMPGTKMTFAGLHDPKDRIDLIAYLKVETGYKPPKG
jgi:cytochrome c